MKTSGSKALFTCTPLLPVALEAASNCGIPKNRVYILNLPKEATGGKETPKEYKTVDQLIEEGKDLPRLEDLKWKKGQGARQTAFLCYSSGTSGLPVRVYLFSLCVAVILTDAGLFQKAVMISHRNVISNVLQISTYEKPYRDSLIDMGIQSAYTDIALGLLPQSHIYALVVICHATTYRGDQVINLPKFELRQYLEAIQRFKISTLYLVSLSVCSSDTLGILPKLSLHYSF